MTRFWIVATLGHMVCYHRAVLDRLKNRVLGATDWRGHSGGTESGLQLSNISGPKLSK